MDSKQCWQVFMDSGIPEYYLMYQQLKKMEESHVSYDLGTGTSGLSVQ